MIDFRLFVAIYSARFIAFVLSLFPQYGGGTLPGYIALMIDHRLVIKLSKVFTKKIIITGTNGKTTTTKLIAHLFHKNNISFIYNKAGSNLKRGIATQLCLKYHKKNSKDTIALFETDEAVFPEIAGEINPDIVVITNVFRDQLDRYGEVENVVHKWSLALDNLAASTILLLNANDPHLSNLGQRAKQKIHYFAVNNPDKNIADNTSDIKFCPVCASKLIYQSVVYSHLGNYYCSSCSFAMPPADFLLTHDKKGYCVTDKKSSNTQTVKSFLPEQYNSYNLLAAYAVVRLLKIEIYNLNSLVKDFLPAFGRGEEFVYKNKKVKIMLIKNPTGLNQVIAHINSQNRRSSILFAINDLLADGRDVSWLWDAEIENIKGERHEVYVSGLRADDMALRLKIAGINSKKEFENISIALKYMLNLDEDYCYILPTYTALLHLKKIMQKTKINESKWHE